VGEGGLEEGGDEDEWEAEIFDREGESVMVEE